MQLSTKPKNPKSRKHDHKISECDASNQRIKWQFLIINHKIFV